MKPLFFFILAIFLIGFVSSATTTIQLQDADTENLEDTWSKSQGAGTSFCCGNGFIKFNIQDIPSNAYDIDAQLYMGVLERDGADTVAYARINNQTWTETSGGLGSLSITNETFKEGFGSFPGWDNLNVTDQFNEDFNLNNNNFSIAFDEGTSVTLYGGLLESSSDNLIIGYKGENPNHYFNFTSKEFPTASLRPYLNVTYSTLDPGATVNTNIIQGNRSCFAYNYLDNKDGGTCNK